MGFSNCILSAGYILNRAASLEIGMPWVSENDVLDILNVL